MKSDDNFICGAVALELVYAAPSLPPDAWDLFLVRVRERLIRIATDGYRIQNLVIFPEEHGTRLVKVSVEHDDSRVECFVWNQDINA